jgi:glycyl-tRNA synthetase beta chain
MSNFLVEIGLEEMPAHVVTPAMNQLAEKVRIFLDEKKISFDTVEGFSTPRRLAIRVNGISSKQEDVSEIVKGPAKKAAYDNEGNLSRAVLGFLQSKGCKEEDLFFDEVKGVEYAFVKKESIGQLTIEVLKELPEVMKNLNFPVSMRWANFDTEYIRPVHWLVALMDGEVVPMEFLGVSAGKMSRGHRLSSVMPLIASADTYESDLLSADVLVNPRERKEKIISQIQQLESKNHWEVEIDEKLLEEVNNLVEMPTAFAGSFDEKYLEVPEEVLITSMKEHQRFFDVRNTEGELLPKFVSVRNGGENHLQNVIRGNEKVLVARLEDSEFFWKEDKRLKISDLVEKLRNVTFHEKIGSLHAHMLRTKKIAEILADRLQITETEKKDLLRSADIYKFDLLTNMVGEFPELQGIMGDKYARLQGETEAVGTAIREHYLPISSDGNLPETVVGSILAISDKLESVYSFFSNNLQPSGSNDPYALRRAVLGVIRILEKNGWDLDFLAFQTEIFTEINANVEDFEITYTHDEEVFEFVKGRISQLLNAEISRKDILDASIHSIVSSISQIFDTARVLNDRQNDASFRSGIESLTRVVNLSKKATVAVMVNPQLFENESETALYEAIKELTENFLPTSTGKYEQLIALEPLITAYFENTMVMSDDEKVKFNRLSVLKELATLIQRFAAVERLIVK